MSRYPLFFFLIFISIKGYGQQQIVYDDILEIIEEGEYKLALESVSSYLQDNPQESYLYYLKAIANERLGEIDKAFTNYNIYLSFEPYDSEARFSRAVIYYKKKNYDAAIEDLSKILEYPITNTSNTVYFERSASSENRIFTAVGGLLPRVYYYLGLSYHEKEDYHKSIAYYDTTLIYHPYNADYLTSLGLTYQKAGMITKAKGKYLEALGINPDHDLARYNLNILYAELDPTSFKLKDSINAIIDRSGEDEFTLAERAVISYNQGLYQEALDDINKALKISPDNIEYLIDRGRTYIKLKQWSNAKKDFTNVLDKKSSIPEAYFNLGIISFNKENFKQAIEEFNLAILYDPGYVLAYVNKAIIQHRLEEYISACEALKKAQNLGYEPSKKMLNEFCIN